MKHIDLDDLPPRVAKALAGLERDEELVLVQGGVVVARLAAMPAVPVQADELADQSPEDRMTEVLEQFNAMIHDEF